MRPGRLLICLLLIAGGLAISVRSLSSLSRSLHALAHESAGLRPAMPPGRPEVARPGVSIKRPATRLPSSPRSARDRPGSDASSPGGSSGPVARAALEVAGGLGLVGLLALGLVGRRAVYRRTRRYALYELHLSTHDQAKAQDLEDMVEAIANIVRAWPADRALHGQPYVGLELICGGTISASGRMEMEWSINVRCEPRIVTALDGAISAAYPDVRVGRRHGEQPRPRLERLREPGCVMRFRKERSFVYSLIADGEREASSPVEQIARAQVAMAAPSLVRFQLTPTPTYFEELARRLYRRHENKLIHQERWGLREGGLSSTFNRAEMRAAERTQNRGLFWLETVVAADSRDVCKAVAAAVQSRRGENRLHRRWMFIRQRMYRRRFPRALGPLVPSFRALVSAAEVAHLLELPSARMKGVPVRRVPIPRIPAPPEVARGSRRRAQAPAAGETLAAVAEVGMSGP